jgi:hypothetical protein
MMPINHERIEGTVIDNVYMDALRTEIGSLEYRLGVGSNERFGLGVADEPCGLCGVSRGERNGETS